jgi:hypothetical protein
MTEPDKERLYVVINGAMYWKVDGVMREIPQHPMPPDVAEEVRVVWQEYDARARPFVSYHSVPPAKEERANAKA